MGIDSTISPIDMSIKAIEPLARPAGQAKESEQPAGGFVEMLRSQLDEMVELQNEADQLQQDLMAGKIDDINQVILAVQKADLALNFALELRNKVVEAYQEINRMQL